MADINTLPEELVINILSRLPVKPLLFSKCVSKYWYGLINDANFMRRRCRHMVFLPLSPLSSLDVNDKSIIKVSDLLDSRPNRVRILGTVYGVVLLVVERSGKNEFILYNPFTGAHKSVPDPDPDPPLAICCCAYGFGYGSSPKDLKVVEFVFSSEFRVFSFEGGSWSALRGLYQDFNFDHKVGTFLNGFVHWIARRGGNLFIAAFDMMKLVFTEMWIPATCYVFESLLDRTREGYLCLVCVHECCKVDMWVMKEYGLEESWSLLFSVSLISVGYDYWLYPIAVLGNWKIVFLEHPSKEIVIYDMEKVTSKKVTDGKNIDKPFFMTRGIEYVESLISPSAYF